MKDYYSILEINESASTETVDKVHKLLVKKYHPDLQTDENKASAELKLKDINEAYEVLTNPEKKEIYDARLKEYRIQEIIKEIKQKNIEEDISKENQNKDNIVQTYSEDNTVFNVSDDEIRRQAQVYYDELYNQYLYRNGYIKNYKAVFKNYLVKTITAIVVIGIIYLFLKIPYTRNLIKNLIDSNEISKVLLGNFLK